MSQYVILSGTRTPDEPSRKAIVAIPKSLLTKLRLYYAFRMVQPYQKANNVPCNTKYITICILYGFLSVPIEQIFHVPQNVREYERNLG